MTGADFVEALKTALETRFAADPDFDNVNVYLWRDNVNPPGVVLVRDRVHSDVEYMTMGLGRVEEITVPMLVGTIAPTIAEAADQAEAIIDEISQQLQVSPPSVGTQTWNAKVTNAGWLPLPSDKGGVICDYEFDVVYTADLD